MQWIFNRCSLDETTTRVQKQLTITIFTEQSQKWLRFGLYQRSPLLRFFLHLFTRHVMSCHIYGIDEQEINRKQEQIQTNNRQFLLLNIIKRENRDKKINHSLKQKKIYIWETNFNKMFFDDDKL